MASGAVYPSSANWDYPTGYPHDDRYQEYTPYTSARPLQQYPQHSHAHQAWVPPSRLSYDSYQDTPYMRPSPVPSMHASPPSLRHSLADDPAFAPDPNTIPTIGLFRGIRSPQPIFPSVLILALTFHLGLCHNPALS
ncbi:hypothetical protein EI94DRAFT_979848 [Lactarius quietus]|nr:hypothetical protein EI94DRAFT_979848 [Lactarius quietus]